MIRAVIRGVRLLGIIALAICNAVWRIASSDPADRRWVRAEWFSRWSGVFCRLLRIEIETRGIPPHRGLIVSNHLGYLDIVALASIRPCVFVSKIEVRSWPVIGVLARLGGTVFIDRRAKRDVLRVAAEMRRLLDGGLLVVLFPEGTSSNGATVLPFRSALLESAVRSGSGATSAAIDYRSEAGSVADEVCYWGEMTFFPHLANLFSKPRLTATLRFAERPLLSDDRKELSRRLRREVIALRAHAYTPSIPENQAGQCFQGDFSSVNAAELMQ